MDHVCHLCFVFALSRLFLAPLSSPDGKALASSLSRDFLLCFFSFSHIRVGSHVVSVRIHCTEKWRTSFLTDVLSKSK